MSSECIWIWRRNPKELNRFQNLSQRTVGLVDLNGDVIREAGLALRRQYPDKWLSTIMLPHDFPHPRIALPETGVPDFFGAGGQMYASRKLRDVLAQPPDVVQYVPIELAAGGPSVVAQDFKWMRVLIEHPAMDREKSIYSTLDDTDIRKPTPLKRATLIERFILPAGFRPPCEIFSAQEALFMWLATDTLAERVQRAGCTGLEFCEPETVGIWNGVRRFRTLKGIGERIVGR